MKPITYPKHLLWLLLLAAQGAVAQTCDCRAAFQFITEKTTLNYAGISFKVTDTNRAAYAAHTAAFKSKTDTLSHPDSCYAACNAWIKWFSDKHLSLAPNEVTMRRRPDSDFALTVLDSQTLLLRLPSMSRQYRQVLHKTLADNAALLGRYPHLILDCRDNGGGNYSTWRPLTDYLYTQPVVTDGTLYWASEDNAQTLLRAIEASDAEKWQKKEGKRFVKEMRKRPGTFVGTMNARRHTRKGVKPNPRKVALLVNGGCGSSCEELVLWAKQSKKTTVMGTTTAGVVDFGDVQYMNVPCHNWTLVYPVQRSNRVVDGRGIDGKGIAPDVLLDPTTDKTWIEQARLRLKE